MTFRQLAVIFPTSFAGLVPEMGNAVFGKKPKTNIAKNLRNRNRELLKLNGSPLCFYARTYGADCSRDVRPLFSHPGVLSLL